MSWRGWCCITFVLACSNGGASVAGTAGVGELQPVTSHVAAPPAAPSGMQLPSSDSDRPDLVPIAGSGALFPECVTTGTIEASLRPANVLFVIDRSGSLNCNLPPATSSEECERTPSKADPSLPSKWEIVHAALRAAISQLPDAARAGISYFSNDDRCGVSSKPAVPIRALDANQRSALEQSLDRVELRGGTPIVGGLILAFKHLNPDQTPDVPNGNRFIVLLTDGEEGCATDQTSRLLDIELPKSRTAGIATFVIGVPGSEVNRGFLSRLAFAGGTPSRLDCDHTSSDPTLGDCQFDMTRDAELAAGLSRALAAIGGEALRCEFDVPRPANGEELDHDTVNVVYTERAGAEERIIAQDAASPCERANGWQYTADKTKIVLCGTACNAVRNAASIRIALGCKTAVLL